MTFRILLFIVLSLSLHAIAQSVVSIENATFIDMGKGIVTVSKDSPMDYYCSTEDGPYYLCVTLRIKEDTLLKSIERFKETSTSPMLFYLWMKSSKSMIPLYGGEIHYSNDCYEQKLIADIPSKYLPFKQTLAVKSFFNKHKLNKLKRKLQGECLLYYYDFHTSFYKKITSIKIMIAYSDKEKNIFLETYPHIPNNEIDF